MSPELLNSSNSFNIRRLTPSDADAFRSVRLEALQNAPEAFGSTFEKESAEPLQHFVDRLARNVVFGGFLDLSLVGVAGFYKQEGTKMNHKGVLWGMYVKREARGSGLATALVETVLDHASKEVEQVQLTVVVNNARARRFYERMGFVEYGLEKESLKYHGAYFDEALMVKFLRKME
ncbi:MAG TPA: GNAT family N-acetyltransferase [Chthoniobacterales bacterium]|nr:GNAT family N-acetyltransferase [Chthoniobacterales bacterium]